MNTRIHGAGRCACLLIAAALLAGLLAAPARGQATINPEAATPTPMVTTPAPSAGTRKSPTGWWTDAVFYQVFVRSFNDSRIGAKANDGIGDIQGLIDKLDYLNDGKNNPATSMGVKAIWLLPMSESPTYHGYDTTDYFKVESDYGTNEDFKRLVDECHKRGIRVVIDLVLNHHSDKHEWFTRAIDPKSPYHDWYIWNDKDPAWKGPWNQKVWHRVNPPSGKNSLFYYGIFSSRMPDLNYRNADVTKQMDEVVRFWLEDMRVDGFRLDAIRHLIEDGKVQENTPGTHAWLKQFNAKYKAIKGDAFAVGEVWAGSEEIASYVGDELDSCFEFELSSAIIKGIKDGNSDLIGKQIKRTLAAFPELSQSTFLANHDQTRSLTQFGGNLEMARLGAMIQFTLPGVPFVYYGEEIGMLGDKPDEKLRTPMQWTAEKSGSFSDAKAWQPPQADFRRINVKKQEGESGSLLNLYRRLIHARNDSPTLRRGATQVIDSQAPGVLTIVRRGVKTKDAQGLEKSGPTIIGVFNLSDKEVVVPSVTSKGLQIPASAKASILASTMESPLPSTTDLRLDAEGNLWGWAPVSRLPARSGVWIEVK